MAQLPKAFAELADNRKQLMNSDYRRGVALLIILLQCVLATGAFAQSEGRMVPVPRAVIYGGEVIADGALTDKTFGISDIIRLGAVASRSDLVGKVARRTLLPGQPVPAAALKAADVVKQGRPTTAVFEADGLSISGTVIPLQSAAAGEILSFQNMESGAILRGIVQGDGTISVGTP